MTLHHEPDAEFSGTASSITGTAVYEMTKIWDDGSRRFVWTAELVRVECDELPISRDDIAKVCGEDGVRRGEEAAGEKWDSGDYMENAG